MFYLEIINFYSIYKLQKNLDKFNRANMLNHCRQKYNNVYVFKTSLGNDWDVILAEDVRYSGAEQRSCRFWVYM